MVSEKSLKIDFSQNSWLNHDYWFHRRSQFLKTILTILWFTSVRSFGPKAFCFRQKHNSDQKLFFFRIWLDGAPKRRKLRNAEGEKCGNWIFYIGKSSFRSPRARFLCRIRKVTQSITLVRFQNCTNVQSFFDLKILFHKKCSKTTFGCKYDY